MAPLAQPKGGCLTGRFYRRGFPNDCGVLPETDAVAGMNETGAGGNATAIDISAWFRQLTFHTRRYRFSFYFFRCNTLRGEMKRVLIVDDVADIRLMLRYLLENEDYVIVAEAANGVEAVEKYREFTPDITIMDIDMPFKTGVEAAREIRSFAGDARIIFCSGGISKYETNPVHLQMEGMSLIPKPFHPEQLHRAMSM